MSQIKHLKIVATYDVDREVVEFSEAVAEYAIDFKSELIEIEPRNGYVCRRVGAITVSLKATTPDPGPR